jgi:alcohol dehydrogenase (NADP+)
METNFVAPLLCGGITALRPMMTYGVKKGTRVGINGIGGIGHMAILFAKALGAEVTAISRNNNKKELALSLGADHYIATNEEDFAQKYEDSLDLIVNTAFTFNEGEMDGVLNLLSPFGQLIFITAPPITERLALSPMQMLMSNISVAGSMIGSPSDIEYMLKLASEHNIKPMIETLDISVENVKTAWERMLKNDVKFRFVLTGYEKYFDAQN